MPFNGSGAYALPVSTDYPAIADTEISSEDHNATLEDVATALGETILRDGQAPFEANQSMGGFRLTNVGDATADTDACPKGQVDDLITAAEFNTALPLQSASTVGKVPVSDGTNASWQYVQYPRVARTSNTILGAGDTGKFFDITSGTFSQTFDDAATLGSSWNAIYRNNGTGEITLDPHSTQTIDGLTSFKMYPGETRHIWSDGVSALYSVVLTGFEVAFTATGTFTKPPGYRAFDCFVVGPGGGGGSGRRTSSGVKGGGAGGSAGAWVRDTIPAAAFGATETVTVGTGGAGGVAVSVSDTNGNAGSNGSGASSIGTLVSANAGAGSSGGTTGTVSSGSAGAAAGLIAVAGTTGGGSNSGSSETGTAAATTHAATGGGSGGGDTTGTTHDGAAGGASGTSSSATQLAGGALGAKGTTGAAGSAGNTPTAWRGGTGGGGGGYGSSGNGGAGGTGGRGAGGGGGGACTNSGNSGAGGAGGNGFVGIRGMV